MNKKIRIVVLASGSGTNLQAIIDNCENGFIPGEVVAVFSNRQSAFALERARRHGIEAGFINPKDFSDRLSYDMHLSEEIDRYHPDLIAMAGYMLILSPEFIRKYPYRIMNIHPALCPAFPGAHAIREALEYRVKVTGVTVHFADEGTDTGPVILQYPVFVEDDDTEDSLAEKIHRVEHRLYPLAIKLYAEGKLKIEGRHIRVLEPGWKKFLEGAV